MARLVLNYLPHELHKAGDYKLDIPGRITLTVAATVTPLLLAVYEHRLSMAKLLVGQCPYPTCLLLAFCYVLTSIISLQKWEPRSVTQTNTATDPYTMR